MVNIGCCIRMDMDDSYGWQVPVLETEKGCIFESNAIARYVARLSDTGLLGADLQGMVRANACKWFMIETCSSPVHEIGSFLPLKSETCWVYLWRL